MHQSDIWTKILAPEEKIEKEFGISEQYIKYSFVMWMVIGVIMIVGLIGFFILPIAVFYYLYYLKHAHHYAFTNKRVLILKGWLSTRLTSVDYNKITDIRVEESFLEKMSFKSGRLIINTAGTTFNEVDLLHIDNPYQVKQQLDHIREKHI